MRISVRIDSANARARLRQWGGEIMARSRQAAAKALQAEARDMRSAVQTHVAGRLNVARRVFLGGFATKVYAQKPDRFPQLHVYSSIKWAGIHETGGTINGRMLIPLHGRVGTKRFYAQISYLMRSGNAFFIKNAKGHIVLMAKNLPENDDTLAGFKQRYRKAAGIKQLKRNHDIPIAVLVPRVTLRKRLDIERLVAVRVPRMATAIENALGKLD